MPTLASLKALARKMVDRAREDYRAELRARHFPDTAAIPMSEWLAALDARVAASTPPPEPFDYEDFDRRR